MFCWSCFVAVWPVGYRCMCFRTGIQSGRKKKYFHDDIMILNFCEFLDPILQGYRMYGVCWSPPYTHGLLARYVKLRVAHAPGMPGPFSPSPRVSDPDMHHGTCVTHVPWCMPGSLTSGFLWSRWRGKRSRHSRRMRDPQFKVSSKRPMAATRPSRTTK